MVVEEDDKAIPIKNDSSNENLNNKLKKKTKSIDKKSWNNPPIMMNFFKMKILLKFVSNPDVKSKKIIPKYAKLTMASLFANFGNIFPISKPPAI